MSDLITVADATKLISDRLINRPSIKVGSFEEFLINIFSKSFDIPENFKLWHVQFMANKAQEAWESNKDLVCLAARGTYKTTVVAFAFPLWIFLTTLKDSRDLTGAYLSYKEPTSQKRLREFKKNISDNEQLSEWMVDTEKDSEYLFRYRIGNKSCEIMPMGIKAASRGTHTNRFLIADDILKDAENPLNLSDLEKVESRYNGEFYSIPSGKHTIRVLIGTPMAQDDLLMKALDDERYVSIYLPIYNPIPGKYLLCPEIHSEKFLLEYQKKREFAPEMMLIPYSTANSYIKEDLLKTCESLDIEQLDPYREHDFTDDDIIISGCDVGNRVDPTHISVFKVNEKTSEMTQIFQVLHREMMPSSLKEYMNMIAENFKITRGYWDNTRGEMDDRGLENCWRPHTFSLKNKHTLSQKFEELLQNKKINLFFDTEQHMQILSVNGNIQAVRTGRAHGEAFMSNILAIRAYDELIGNERTQVVGNVQDFTNVKEGNISAVGKQIQSGNGNDFCPDCGLGSPAWIKENTLCLVCGHDSRVK